MNTFFSKDEPAISEHHYHITKTVQRKTHNLYNIDKARTSNIIKHRYTDTHHYDKTQNVNNDFTSDMSKTHLIMSMKILNFTLLKTVLATILISDCLC